MKSTESKQTSPKDSQTLSWLRSQTGGEENLPTAKLIESWVHAPTGLRPPCTSSVGSSLRSPIPEIFVPGRRPETVPQVTGGHPGDTVAPEGPLMAWRARKTGRTGKRTAFFITAGLAAAALSVLSFLCGKAVGRESASHNIKPEAPSKEFPAAALPDLDAALALLRKGKSLEALEALKALLNSHPDAPSVHYATAISAIQAGYPREAERMADASIKHGFRVSDSLALKAALLPAGATAEREALLKRAITADPMNPCPLLELASLYREQKQPDLARSALESAAFRLNPADAQTVLETTRAIMDMDQTGELPPVAQPLGIPSRDFPNAYAEMKRGNFQNAVTILKFCSNFTTPDLFAYLLNDPALRKFARRTELSEFY